MLDVFFTVDVEVWCDGWDDIDRKFPDAFRQYVYGTTPRGDYGLPYKLRVLGDHGLTGVFFVEPLFAARFGLEPLAEIVGLVRDGGQEVQLHMHTEWVDEARRPLLAGVNRKRQHLRHYSLEEQTILLAEGAKLVERAGGGAVTAFRAGSFGFNSDTLTALVANGITFDSSYNASMMGPDSGVMPGIDLVDTVLCEGVYEYPMTVFRDGTRSLRHAQLTACSYAEMEGLLWQALESGRNSFVILSHNFELLNDTRSRADDVVVDRFRRLCSFLDRNRDSFRVSGFKGLKPRVGDSRPAPLVSPIWRTGARMLEQAYRRTYR
jgi:hypothetical protein